MRDQGRIHGPSGDPVEFLRRRLAEQDRKLDDLYRRLGEKPPKIEPPASGGTSEAFAYSFDETLTTSTTVNTSTGALNLNTFSGSFVTSGISKSGEVLTLPAGLWIVGVDQRLTPSADPTDNNVDYSLFNTTGSPGYVSLSFDISWNDISDNFNESVYSGETNNSSLGYVGSSWDLYMSIGNSTNVTVRARGTVWGVQLAAAPITIS